MQQHQPYVRYPLYTAELQSSMSLLCYSSNNSRSSMLYQSRMLMTWERAHIYYGYVYHRPARLPAVDQFPERQRTIHSLLFILRNPRRGHSWEPTRVEQGVRTRNELDCACRRTGDTYDRAERVLDHAWGKQCLDCPCSARMGRRELMGTRKRML